MSDARKPLYYTFGNHMHWVDMQWLWGYDVLPGCVSDMLHLIGETGAKGNVNFDGIGYEKMAAECPEALADLRAAVHRGDVEPVGCSYGQPYGLFHGGESNIRQFTHGVRSVRRLLGVRPKTFWEEEFYFFPQLPQLLRQCGFTGVSMFFQWTWHTPEVPKEPHSLIMWEGIDGTQIATLPRNDLNVHQWPEDFDGLLEGPLVHERSVQWGPPVIAQWLELMPTRDWMCRSELLLPRLRELMGDDRFEMRARTCSALIDELKAQAGASGSEIPVRQYTMDDVWHGMTLGKNGDRHPRTSRQIESLILFAESMSAVASLFGRPYPSWDAYPTWEIDEAWRELLAAQHHDNHECEGLCGFVGYHQMGKADALAFEVAQRAKGQLQERVENVITANPGGWAEEVEADQDGIVQRTIPPFGYADVDFDDRVMDERELKQRGDIVTLSRGDVAVEVDVKKGGIRQITTRDFPDGVLSGDGAFLDFSMMIDGERGSLGEARSDFVDEEMPDELWVNFESLRVEVSIAPLADAVNIVWRIDEDEEPRPDPGLRGALTGSISPSFTIDRLVSDSAHASHEIEGTSTGKRKYPEGDWMTSPQWFEDVENAVHALSWLDLQSADGSGLLVINNGTQQWFNEDNSVRGVLYAADPWDGGRLEVDNMREMRISLFPHAKIGDADRTRMASRCVGNDGNGDVRRIVHNETSGFGIGGGELPDEPDLPPVFGPLEIEDAPNVLAHAFFRESMKSGEHFPDWAGHRMFRESEGACDHPFAVRLVEWDGEAAEVSLVLAGDVALAARTNLMGETGDWKMGEAPADCPPHLEDTGWLDVEEDVEPPVWAIVDGERIAFRGEPIRWSRVRFPMRQREIATVMADMVMGRKEWRDLDAKRKVWAQIHKTKREDEPTDGAS